MAQPIDVSAKTARPSATSVLPTREAPARHRRDASGQPTANSVALNMARNWTAEPAKKVLGERNSAEVHAAVPVRLSSQETTLSAASKANGGSSSARLASREQHEQRRHQSSAKTSQSTVSSASRTPSHAPTSRHQPDRERQPSIQAGGSTRSV